MNIPINQFEQIIDETILKRGLDYFRKGLVEEPEELSPGLYEAIVQGSEPYRVSITIKNEVITDYSCTCPYDFGPVCKHVVSLLFALQGDSMGIRVRGKKTSAAPKQKSEKKAGPKTVKEQVDEILSKLSVEALEGFIREQSLADPAFRRRFLAEFTSSIKGESKSVYAQQVKSILQSAKGRGGFIEWNRAASVSKAVYGLLSSAKKHLEMKNYQTAMLISCAVLEEMVKALQFADDSDGDIGGCVEAAVETLGQAAASKLPEEQRKWLFDYAATAFQKKLFDGWDWHMGIVRLAAEVTQEKQEAELLLKLLESVPHSEYEADRAREMVLLILRKSGQDEEADAYMARHLKDPSIREQAIKQAMELGDLKKAGDLARQGILQDKKDKPGLANQWVDWLLKIALEQKDREAAVTHARYLFGQFNRDHRQYYKILKTQVDESEWPAFVDKLIKDIAGKDSWSDTHMLAWLCIQEERWKQLLQTISQHLTLNGIKEYEPYLAKLYPEELAGLYKHGILELLERGTGRNHYQEAARFVRRMKKIGEVKQAEEFVKQLKQKYPQRRALLEELEKV